MITTDERAPSERREQDLKLRQMAINMRVAMPGIIRSFDPVEQTVTVQCAIREKVNMDGNLSWQDIPLLLDVPIVIPRAGGYTVTLPIKPGDECLVVFGDSCMDAWWQSGGVQNQIDCRRHDLSDGYALIGVYSQPRRISNYSTNSVQLRNDAGDAYFEIKGNEINIKAAGGVHIESGSEFTASSVTYSTFTGSNISIGSNGNTIIDNRNFLGHTHTGVEPGGGSTGGVN